MVSKIDQYVEHVNASKEENNNNDVDAAKEMLDNAELHNEENVGSRIMNDAVGDDDEVFVLVDVEVPKVLGDIVEALIGAVFLDSG